MTDKREEARDKAMARFYDYGLIHPINNNVVEAAGRFMFDAGYDAGRSALRAKLSEVEREREILRDIVKGYYESCKCTELQDDFYCQNCNDARFAYADKPSGGTDRKTDASDLANLRRILAGAILIRGCGWNIRRTFGTETYEAERQGKGRKDGFETIEQASAWIGGGKDGE